MTMQIIAYFILSIAIVAYGTNKLLPSGTGRAILFGIGSTLLFIFFGFRWFSSNRSSSKSNTWPPTINTCPDYLTFVPTVTGSISSSGGGCVDTLGVSNNNGLIKRTSTTGISYPGGNFNTGGSVFPYTSADVKSTNLTDICTACSTAGITWEGVYDGDSCVAAAAAAKAAAASECPA